MIHRLLFFMALVFCGSALGQTASISPEEALILGESNKVLEKKDSPSSSNTTEKPSSEVTSEKNDAEPWLTQLGNTKFKPLRRSIMFRDEDIQMANKILLALKGGGDSALINELLPKDDPIQEIIQQSEVKPKRALPVFFMSSLVYEDADKWSAWVNGKKLDAQKLTLGDDNEVEVVDVDAGGLTIAWAAENVDELLRKRDEIASDELIPDPTLSIKQNVAWRGDDGRLWIRLRSNQSFYVFDMRAREGLPFRSPDLARQFYWPPPMLPSPKEQTGSNKNPSELTNNPTDSLLTPPSGMPPSFSSSQIPGAMKSTTR